MTLYSIILIFDSYSFFQLISPKIFVRFIEKVSLEWTKSKSGKNFQNILNTFEVNLEHNNILIILSILFTEIVPNHNFTIHRNEIFSKYKSQICQILQTFQLNEND